jgi:murein DD-endopeptidase MepM/ murein hydrolase activator NlpD
MRKSNEEKLLEVGRNTASSMLWKGEFLRLPNSANRAGFADHRSYIYGGRVVDEQTHLGLDLASLAMAPIPAANSGRVVFAGNLGIYGQLVIVDHGLGLMSLYSHMSEIAVNVGTEVKKGDILGRTGTTGMAGGDHLHFGMLVSGVQVQPIEWLDSHWIKDNVIDRLEPKAQ